MNILVFSWRDPKHPLAGGAEQVMHEHMKGWVSAGHNVTLYASYFNSAKSTEVIDDVTVIRKGRQLLGVNFAGFLYYQKNKNKYDLIVDQFHGIPFFTPLYSKKPKIAVLQEVAREVWLQNDLPKPFNWIIGRIGYLLEPLFFLPYKKIKFITGSTSAKTDLIKMGIPNKNITIINHGVIIKKPNNNIQKNKIITIVFLGALARDKGIEDAIKTFSLLNKRGNYKFWIIGKGSDTYLNILRKIAEKEKILNKIKFWGFVSQDKKFELLKRSHVLINPSVREGWGLVNIEANSMGVPVVAYKSQGLIDSVKENKSGIFCDNNTPENMCEKVTELLLNKPKYLKMQNSALQWSKEFDWGRSCERSLKLIKFLGDCSPDDF